MPADYNFLLKQQSSSRTLSFSSSSSAERRPRSAYFRKPKIWKSEGAKTGLWGGWERTVYRIVAIASPVRTLVWGLALSWRSAWFILLFGRTLRILFFFLTPLMLTYRCELTVTHLPKNSTNTTLSLSQKTLTMTFSRSNLHLEFFLEWRRLTMPFPRSSFRQWVTTMNPGFITGNYSWQKNISVFLSALEKFCLTVSNSGYPVGAMFSVAKNSDDGQSHRFSKPQCGAKSTFCDVKIIPYQRNNLIFGLCDRCRDMSVRRCRVRHQCPLKRLTQRLS